MENYINNKNTKISYKLFGNGPALLLVHGMGRNKEMWEENDWVDLLKNHFTVITMDIRGHGESDKSYESTFYATENIISDINTLISNLGFSEFSYFGHSYGATIGLQLCKYNANIKKCICAGTTFGDKFFKETVPLWIQQYRRFEEMKKNNYFDTSEISFEDIAWLKKTDLQLLISQMESWISWNGVSIEDINCPLYVYTGTNDSPEVIKNFKSNEDTFKINNIKYTIFDNLNHKDLVEKIELISPAILDFLIN